MPCYVMTQKTCLARGYTVVKFLDISTPPGRSWTVSRYMDEQMLFTSPGMRKEAADELYEAFEMSYGPRGNPGWLAVLRRLRGIAPDKPAQWEGSAGEYAARFHGVGTWEWVESLRVIRERRKAA